MLVVSTLIPCNWTNVGMLHQNKLSKKDRAQIQSSPMALSVKSATTNMMTSPITLDSSATNMVAWDTIVSNVA